MAIVNAELKAYRSKVVTNTATNGGRLSSNEAVSGVANNIFPDAFADEILAGVTHFRKVFMKVADSENLTLNGAFAYLKNITLADSRYRLFSATQTDTQADILTPRYYGAGALASDVSASDITITVDAEPGGGADLIFQDGDLLVISDGTSVEKATIAAGGVSWATDQATVTLTAGLLNSYAAATPTNVSSLLEQASVSTSFDGFTVTSASGTYDDTGSPVGLDNIGSVEENWTLTFSDATNFSVSGDTVGAVGSGTVGVDFSPVNVDFSRDYFTLLAAGFGGTFAVAETIVFSTHPAALPIWLERIIPAGSASAADLPVLVFGGESAP